MAVEKRMLLVTWNKFAVALREIMIVCLEWAQQCHRQFKDVSSKLHL